MARIVARRAQGPSLEATAAVQTWGPDPIGANQAEAVAAANGVLWAGHTYPNPAGWGLAGSVEATDSQYWASPQAFSAAGGRSALSVFATGADRPTVYPQSADLAQVALPGPSGV